MNKSNETLNFQYHRSFQCDTICFLRIYQKLCFSLSANKSCCSPWYCPYLLRLKRWESVYTIWFECIILYKLQTIISMMKWFFNGKIHLALCCVASLFHSAVAIHMFRMRFPCISFILFSLSYTFTLHFIRASLLARIRSPTLGWTAFMCTHQYNHRRMWWYMI